MKNKKHIHTYDENGKMTCCSLEEKLDTKTPTPIAKEKDQHSFELKLPEGLADGVYLMNACLNGEVIGTSKVVVQ